jgi:5-methylcytosine-specific restriction enzyme A
MPTKPLRPCRICGRASEDGYCPEHQSKRWDDGRANSGERGYDSQWNRFSKWYKRRHPICSCGQPTYIPHHKVPLSEGGSKYDESNLEPLCIACHNRIHHAKQK